jgi:serine/threonine-protein phosphatase 2A regulatory subunit B
MCGLAWSWMRCSCVFSSLLPPRSIFDKFESAASSDGSRYVTGSYNNHFVIHHVPSNSNITVEALKDPPKRKPKQLPAGGPKLTPKKKDGDVTPTNETTPETPNVNLMDFGKKALHVSYHPSQHVIAIAGLNKLYIYQAINAQL